MFLLWKNCQKVSKPRFASRYKLIVASCMSVLRMAVTVSSDHWKGPFPFWEWRVADILHNRWSTVNYVPTIRWMYSYLVPTAIVLVKITCFWSHVLKRLEYVCLIVNAILATNQRASQKNVCNSYVHCAVECWEQTQIPQPLRNHEIILSCVFFSSFFPLSLSLLILIPLSIFSFFKMCMNKGANLLHCS